MRTSDYVVKESRSIIQSEETKKRTIKDPDRHFTRNRKLSYVMLISMILSHFQSTIQSALNHFQPLVDAGIMMYQSASGALAVKNIWATAGRRCKRMKMLKTLKTSKRTYEDIIAFDSIQEAENAGFHRLYRDEATSSAIYGKPLDPDFPKVCRVAVVFDGVKSNT